MIPKKKRTIEINSLDTDPTRSNRSFYCIATIEYNKPTKSFKLTKVFFEFGREGGVSSITSKEEEKSALLEIARNWPNAYNKIRTYVNIPPLKKAKEKIYNRRVKRLKEEIRSHEEEIERLRRKLKKELRKLSKIRNC